MPYCNVCHKHLNGVSFSAAPKCLVKRALWEESLDCKLGDNARICEMHFRASHWKSMANSGKALKRKRLNDDAVPQRESQLNPPKEGYFNASTQTQDNILKSTILVDNKDLKKKIRDLEYENDSLRQQLREYKQLEMSLGQIFTETQVKILKSGKRSTFTPTDISAAICLHTAGPRAYKYLYAKGFPLPGRATLYKWLADIKVTTGTLDVVIDLMENEEMTDVDKLCVLSFDEMKIAEDDSSADVAKNSSNYVQLGIVRGLNKLWKQPVFFDFNNIMDADTLHSIISKLHLKGYPVVAIASDLGAGNQSLWGELGISETKPWFTHPADKDLKIFVFSDTPHLMKLLRNHYVESGLIINGKKLTNVTVQQTISHCAKSDVSTTLKITNKHLNIDLLDKQNFKLATQLFSKTTASSIRRCFELGLDIENACETADLFEIVNDWFRVFNSKIIKTSSIGPPQHYGKELNAQRAILTKMSEIMSKEIVDKAGKLPFQKGILINNASLDGLFSYLSAKYGKQNIITSRLHQAIAENFFCDMLSKGEHFENPTALQFKNRLKKYITSLTTLS